MLRLTSMQVKKVLLALLILPWFAGCSLLPSQKLVSAPEVKVVEHSLTGLSLDKAKLEIEFEVYNPNKFSVNLGAIDFDLTVQNVQVIKGEQKQQNKLAAQKKQRIKLPLEVEFSELGRLVGSLKGANSVHYRLAGGVMFELPLAVQKRIPYQVEGQLPVPRLPSLRLAGIEQKKIGLDGVDFNVKFDLQNPNSFDVLLSKFNYGLALNGHKLTTGALPQVVQLQAEAGSQVSVPVRLNFSLDTAKALMQLFQKGRQVNYQFNLDAEVGSNLKVLPALPYAAKQSGIIILN